MLQHICGSTAGLVLWCYCGGLSDVEIRHQAGRVWGWSRFEGMAVWASVWGWSRGAVLGGVRMVSAMALTGVPLGSCVVFILEIR